MPERENLLKRLEDLSLGTYSLLVEAFPGRYDEEASFHLHLAEGGRVSVPPVFSGLLNVGRKSAGTRGFLDGCYFEHTKVEDRTVCLQEERLDVALFQALGDLIRPGGSLMVAYEMFSGESGVHKETWRALMLGIPYAATPLGSLLFHAGCRSFKNWDIAEGGLEGFRKLQGIKPLDEGHRGELERLLRNELEAFLASLELSGYTDISAASKTRAAELLKDLGG